jgi:hypothetical protein
VTAIPKTKRCGDERVEVATARGEGDGEHAHGADFKAMQTDRVMVLTVLPGT